jgi:hypothetical protein
MLVLALAAAHGVQGERGRPHQDGDLQMPESQQQQLQQLCTNGWIPVGLTMQEACYTHTHTGAGKTHHRPPVTVSAHCWQQLCPRSAKGQ